MQAVVTVLAICVIFAQPSPERTETLVLPHALHLGETALLEVKVGVIARGAEIAISTTSGRLLGVVSPFGIRAGSQAGTYTIPLPSDSISNGRITVHLSLNYYHAQRAPTREEVKSVRVKIVDASNKH